MGTKEKPGQFDCYELALPDEPMFILLARDPSAPATVEAWALRRLGMIRNGQASLDDAAKATEAFVCANQMRNWRQNNNGKWRQLPLFEETSEQPEICHAITLAPDEND
jgi:hypothetical protein